MTLNEAADELFRNIQAATPPCPGGRHRLGMRTMSLDDHGNRTPSPEHPDTAKVMTQCRKCGKWAVTLDWYSGQ